MANETMQARRRLKEKLSHRIPPEQMVLIYELLREIEAECDTLQTRAKAAESELKCAVADAYKDFRLADIAEGERGWCTPEKHAELKQTLRMAARVLDAACDGKTILAYQEQQHADFARANSFETTISAYQPLIGQMTLRLVAVNGAGGSLALKAVYDPARHDAVCTFHWTGRRWKISLYTDKPNVDVGIIAKSRGGGGHRGAAGFTATDLSDLGIGVHHAASK